MSDGPNRSFDEVLLGFTHALRAAGVSVSVERSQTFLEAVAKLGADRGTMVRAAGRATLCSDPEALARLDRVFAEWFGAQPPAGSAQPSVERAAVVHLPRRDAFSEVEEDSTTEITSASDVEVLRHRDVAVMTDAEKEQFDAMLGTLRPRLPYRRSARWAHARRGDIDPSRTLRTWMRYHGEPVKVLKRRRGWRARRVVLLVDISGSMRPYADAILLLANRLVRGAERLDSVEVFTLGTRLTRVTLAMRSRDPHLGLSQAGQQIADWGGGTRLGEMLGNFLRRTSETARGAVVVVFSDGWERGGVEDLALSVERLHRLAHRVVWVNPHRGKRGYEPVQQGIVAVLPHVDDMVAGHSLEAFDHVLKLIERA